MFGTINSAGILEMSANFILNRTSRFNVAVIEIIQKDLFDLSDKMKKPIKQIEVAAQIAIESQEDFKDLVDNVLKLRSQKSTDQNMTSSRSHLVFEFSVDESAAKMAVIDLAGWENPHNKVDMKETSFINASLTSFNMVLTNISKKQIPSYDSTLSKIFRPYFINDSEICMFYHVSYSAIKKGLENIKNVVIANKERKERKDLYRKPLQELNGRAFAIRN